VANALCSEIPGTKDAQFETAQKIFDFTFDDMEAILQQAKDQVNRIAQSLAIEIEPPSGIAPLLSEKDREIQAGLMRQVRDIALLQGTFQNIIDANDISTILKVVHQGIKILFDIKDVLFFLYDQQQNILIGADIENNLTQELTIQFDEGRSILVTSLKTASICNSFSRESRTELTIIDEQLIRVLGKKGIICLPMIAQEQNVGVVVLGTDEAHVSQINNHMDLLRRFAAHAALAIHAESVRESQAKVVLSERLAASTAIAKKVAHEVNNPLSIIKNYLKILEIDLSEKDISTAELKIINEEIDRVASIVDELSDFSQPKAQNLEPLDLNELLTDIIKLTGEPLSQKNIKVSFDMDPLLPVLISSKNGLKQVFINLVRNASEALKQGGNIHMVTKYSAASGSVEITVADDGPGLSDIIKSRLFEPYMSTKGGRHTGLGLSVVYSTVKELRGNISCTTDKGRGTIFKIVLPISANKE
jgi:signal transduction histidine kinase